MSVVTDVPAYAAALAAVVGVGSLIVNASKNRDDRRAASHHLLEERFAAAVGNLGAENGSLQISGVVALQFLARTNDAEMPYRAALVLISNSKIHHHESVRTVMVAALQEVLPATLSMSHRRPLLNLARAQLPMLDLSRDLGGESRTRGNRQRKYQQGHGPIDLAEADIAFADLRGARLQHCVLRRSKGYKVQLRDAHLENADLREARLHKAQAQSACFDGANLVSTKLKRAVLDGASFRGAALQSAHFDRATLLGADFRGANVDDTFFLSARFDDRALLTLLRSRNLEPNRNPAHFSPWTLDRLEYLEERSP